MITPSFGLTATERILPKLALDFTTAALDPRITFTRSGDTATVINSSGYVASVLANVPRFDYDPSTLQCKGLLIEEARTNLLSYSSLFEDASWNTKTNISLAGGIDDPAGGTNAYTLTATAANGVLQKAPTITSGIAYSGSIWIRRRTGTGTINMRVAELTAFPLTVTSSWTRVSVTNTSASTTGRFAIQIVTSGDEIDIWGAQLEAGAFATSYIPTTTTALTRNADVATMTGTNFSDWYNASEGAFEVSYAVNALTKNCNVMAVSDNTQNNRMAIRGMTTGNAASVLGLNSAVTEWSFTFTSQQINTITNICFGYKANDIAASRNAVSPSTDTLASIPVVNRCNIGADGDGSNLLNGYIKKLNYWPQRIINAEIQTFSK